MGGSYPVVLRDLFRSLRFCVNEGSSEIVKNRDASGHSPARGKRVKEDRGGCACGTPPLDPAFLKFLKHPKPESLDEVLECSVGQYNVRCNIECLAPAERGERG